MESEISREMESEIAKAIEVTKIFQVMKGV